MNVLLNAFSPVRNLNRLLRRPEGHYPVLDGLRALSILMIIVIHTASLYGALTPGLRLIDLIEESGWAAWVWNSDKSVDVFFVISGFLITGILLREIRKHGRLRLGRFYLRRFLRLSPAYWTVMAVYVAFGLKNSSNIWANILYVNNFLPYEKQAMNWTWTLAIEEQFYLLYPLVLATLAVKTKNPLPWLWGLFGLSFGVILAVILSDETIRSTPLSVFAMDMAFHDRYFSVLYDNFYTRYGALMCGCIAAAYHMLEGPRLRDFLDSTAGKSLGLASLAVILFIMMFPAMSRKYDAYPALSIVYQVFSRNLFSASVACLALAAIEKRAFSRMFERFFSLKIWYPLAQLSYSMYLWHLFPIVVLVKTAAHTAASNPSAGDGSPWAVIAALSVYSTIITILGAVVIYLLVERPVMNLRGKG
jgi:peptidoglycan/LPS O-acetylase OafA/YrhL